MEQINLDNKMFTKMKNNTNYQLDRIIGEIMQENFESGKITITLDVSVIEKEMQVNGVAGIEKRVFNTPSVKWNVKAEMKQADKADGFADVGMKRLTKDNGLYVLEDIETGQAKFVL